MTYRHALAGATAITALAGVPQPAQADPNPTHDPSLQATYRHEYRAVRRLGGRPGRNIVRDGVRRHGRDLPATRRDLHRSLVALRRMKAQLRGTTTPSATSGSGAATSTASTGGSLPACTWQPESGGDYGAVNAASGARGKYQIMPSTYAAYGGDGSWSPSDQERVAHKIYAATGGAAWVNC